MDHFDMSSVKYEQIKEQSTVKLDQDKCKGCINCMKRCPTEAIRVRNGKAKILYERCIACGECIRVCQNRAKRAVYDSFSEIEKFRYKIALPSPSLYGQFNNLDDINYVLTGLKRIGFDDVFEVSAGAEIVSDLTRKVLEDGSVKKPVISSACPAVVELVLIRFHDLKDNLMPYMAPVDVAAKLARARAIEKGIPPEDIGVFFISPCPAKVFALKRGFGVDVPTVDGVLAQSEVYFRLVNEMNKIDVPEKLAESGIVGIGWATSGGEAAGILHDKYLAADGIENCISVLKELEDGKLEDLEFVELNACPGGCVGGVLNIENPFAAKSKIQYLRKYLPVTKSSLKSTNSEAKTWKWTRNPEVQPVFRFDPDRMKAMEKVMAVDAMLKLLPGLDCGNCGAPTCHAFAEDVVKGKVAFSACKRKRNR